MLQKAVQSPFEGLQIGGYAIRPGMFLFKPSAGIVIVSGIQSFEIDDTSIQTLKMHEIGNLEKAHTPPIGMLEKNGVRLPSKFEDVINALQTLTNPIKRKGGLWTHKERDYQAAIKDGGLKSLVGVVHAIYGSYRGQDFKVANAGLSYSERMIGEDVIQYLADEISVSIDFKPGKAKEAIQNLVTLSKGKGMALIEEIAKFPKKYTPYIDDKEFESCFGVKPEMAFMGEAAVIQSSASLKPKESPIFQFPAVSGYIPPVVEAPKPKRPKKIRMGTRPQKEKPASKKPVNDNFSALSEANYKISSKYMDKVTDRSLVAAAFKKAVNLLDAQALEIYIRLSLVKKDHLEEIDAVADDMGLSVSEVTKIHDKAVDTVVSAIGPTKQRFLFTKKIAERGQQTLKSKPKKASLRLSQHNRAVYNYYTKDVPVAGLSRKCFNLAAQHLDAEQLKLHTLMYLIPSAKKSLTEAASILGIEKSTARAMHDDSVEKLLPHFGGAGALNKMPSFLKKIAENETHRSQLNLRKTVVTHSEIVGSQNSAGDDVTVTFTVPRKVFELRERAAVRFFVDENGDPIIQLAGQAGAKIKYTLK